MRIGRWAAGDGGTLVGVASDDADEVRPLAVGALGELLRLPVAEIEERCAATGDPVRPGRPLPPVDGRTEVWAAGVTYRKSREARVEESERSSDVYEQVYDAERPELFFKSAAWRVTGHGGTVSIRADSELNVPEPELALVINAHGEIAGYTVCNDMSSRTIEGVNPLYLPQAKIYLGGCAVGPSIRPVWEVADPYALDIELTIRRAGKTVWSGTANTSELNRRLDDLAAYLFREDVFPDGAILSTGTSLVPEMDFVLTPGDEITIAISEIGALTSTVVRGKAAVELPA